MNSPLTPAPSIPDHELLRRIGRGSYGEVWLARNIMGSFRAVKIVYRAAFESDRPYEREFSGLQKFEPVSRTHPGLVSVLHAGRNAEGGYFYCIMEVADDLSAGQAITVEQYRPRTLASELDRRGRLPLVECLEMGVALAAALGHLHARGLVHRDIKPSNIIFTNGIPKLADIGLVTQIGSKATFVGTEGYLAPEGPGSPLADVYSLGRVLYEISLGKSQDQFPELATRLRELPEANGLLRLNAIVLKACEPQPSKRFRSAEELGAALAQLRAEFGLAGQGLMPARGAGSGAGAKVVILLPAEGAAHANLARGLAERLTAEGFAVFLDTAPEPNVAWARRIESEIRCARAVVPLLSRSSVHNELMAYALELAFQAARRPTLLPLLVPVAVESLEPLPLPISLALKGAALISAEAGAEQTMGKVMAVLRARASSTSE